MRVVLRVKKSSVHCFNQSVDLEVESDVDDETNSEPNLLRQIEYPTQAIPGTLFDLRDISTYIRLHTMPSTGQHDPIRHGTRFPLRDQCKQVLTVLIVFWKGDYESKLDTSRNMMERHMAGKVTEVGISHPICRQMGWHER